MTTATTVDRSEFRHILFSGTIVGLVTSAAVIAFLVGSRLLPAGIVVSLLGTLIVLAAGVSAAFLPASFATSRTTQGIASAAAIGLWGTIVFMAVDIVVLRPLHAFPGRGMPSREAARGGTCPSGGCLEHFSHGWAESSRPLARAAVVRFPFPRSRCLWWSARLPSR